MKSLICIFLVTFFLSCDRKETDLRDKITQETGIDVYNSKYSKSESSSAIGDYSVSKTIKIDSLKLNNIYSQVLVSYNKRNLNKSKWSKLKYGFRFEKLDSKTNEYYQYDFDFIKNNIYYLYIEE